MYCTQCDQCGVSITVADDGILQRCPKCGGRLRPPRNFAGGGGLGKALFLLLVTLVITMAAVWWWPCGGLSLWWKIPLSVVGVIIAIVVGIANAD